jgi:hypothetical protein
LDWLLDWVVESLLVLLEEEDVRLKNVNDREVWFGGVV